MQAKDIMKDAITLETHNTLADARDLMIRYNISRILIVSNGKPVGIITEKSIGKFLLRDGRALDELRLDQVMRRDLITVNEDASIETCAKLMIEHDISSLIVDSKARIFTKSDLVRVYAQLFKNKKRVREYMTENVYTLKSTHSLHTVLSVMVKKKISRIIVIKDSKPIGIITARDLLPTSMLVEKEEEVTSGLTSNITHVLLAKDVMKKPLVINLDEDLATAAQIMVEKRIGGLPTVDNNNDLRGVITKTDILRAIIDLNH
ncbi:MAG: CBS domain-containing protein [Candidatus Nitrosocaldaceae archaeon]